MEVVLDLQMLLFLFFAFNSYPCCLCIDVFQHCLKNFLSASVCYVPGTMDKAQVIVVFLSHRSLCSVSLSFCWSVSLMLCLSFTCTLPKGSVPLIVHSKGCPTHCTERVCPTHCTLLKGSVPLIVHCPKGLSHSLYIAQRVCPTHCTLPKGSVPLIVHRPKGLSHS